MRHRVAGRKLGRTGEHRLALLRNLSTALFAKEKIRTTLAKAKELRPFAEKLVSLSKKETLHARRQVLRHIKDRAVVGKLFESLSARYAQRPGGYTRILKLGPRRGDHAEMALIELVDSEVGAQPQEGSKESRSGKARRKKAAGKKGRAAPASEEEPAPKRKRTLKKKAATKKVAGKKIAGTKAAGKKGVGDEARDTDKSRTRRKKAGKKTARKKGGGS